MSPLTYPLCSLNFYLITYSNYPSRAKDQQISSANYCVDKRDPHSVWGRWTGGCSMRRIDISGIYTQRTCRNEKMPTMGNHFASHRMAKLELSLHVRNITPPNRKDLPVVPVIGISRLILISKLHIGPLIIINL